jgi:hypothetical protein
MAACLGGSCERYIVSLVIYVNCWLLFLLIRLGHWWIVGEVVLVLLHVARRVGGVVGWIGDRTVGAVTPRRRSVEGRRMLATRAVEGRPLAVVGVEDEWVEGGDRLGRKEVVVRVGRGRGEDAA